MKLLYCRQCGDVLRLYGIRRTCRCGSSWGYYLEDDLNAAFGGLAIPLGFTNESFNDALRNRSQDGNGSRFVAFVIPRDCPTVHEFAKEQA